MTHGLKESIFTALKNEERGGKLVLVDRDVTVAYRRIQGGALLSADPLELVSYFVAPCSPIDPEDVEALNAFLASIKIGAETPVEGNVRMYPLEHVLPEEISKRFSIHTKHSIHERPDHLRLARLRFRENVGKYIISREIEINDPKLRESIQGVMRSLSSVDEKPLYRLVDVRPYPNEELARLVAEYEYLKYTVKDLPRDLYEDPYKFAALDRLSGDFILTEDIQALRTGGSPYPQIDL